MQGATSVVNMLVGPGRGRPLSLVILTAVPAAPHLGSGHPGPPLPTHEWLCSLPSHVILGAKAPSFGPCGFQRS